MDFPALNRYQNCLANRVGKNSLHTWDAPIELCNTAFAEIQYACMWLQMGWPKTKVASGDANSGAGWECFRWPKGPLVHLAAPLEGAESKW